MHHLWNRWFHMLLNRLVCTGAVLCAFWPGPFPIVVYTTWEDTPSKTHSIIDFLMHLVGTRASFGMKSSFFSKHNTQFFEAPPRDLPHRRLSSDVSPQMVVRMSRKKMNPGMISGDPWSFQTSPDKPRCCLMNPECPRCIQVSPYVPDAPRWSHTLPGDPTWTQIIPNDPKCFSWSHPEWSQVIPGYDRVLLAVYPRMPFPHVMP